MMILIYFWYLIVDVHVTCFRDQDNGELISAPSMKKFATIFLKSGNINSMNDVLKMIHGFGCKIDQVTNHDCRCIFLEYLY